MKKLTIFLATVAIGATIAFAGTRRLPPIPTPRFSPAEAIKMTEDQLRAQGYKQEEMLLVGIDWSQTESFSGPRLGDGSSYHWPAEGKAEWAWFLTYVQRAKDPEKEISEVMVYRLRIDGHVTTPVKIRT